MNKTVTINLGGIVFHIEENAFKILKAYIDSIKSLFQNSEDREEIIHDIESRIAEMFQQKIKSGSEVVTEKDVENVIAVMGSPKDFEEASKEESYDEKDKSYYASDGKTRKRFYRNPDDKKLGGVCSGISAYFDIDPLWIRLLFVVLLLIGGSSFLIYFILWVIIPEAKTRAQKIEMKGGKVSIENIEKSIKEEVENLKKNFANLKEEAQNINVKKGTEKVRGFFERIMDVFVTTVTFILNFILKILKVVFGFIAFIVIMAITFAIVVSVVGVSQFTNYFSDHFPVIGQTFGNDTMWILCLVLVCGLPLLYLIIKIIQSIFGLKPRKGHAVGLSFLFCWIIGIIILIYMISGIANSFKTKSEFRKVVELVKPANNVLYLDVEDLDRDAQLHGKNNFSINTGFFKMKLSKHNGKFWLMQNVNVDIIQNRQDKIELVHIFSSRGESEEEAEKLASRINYNFTQRDSLLLFNSIFSIKDEEKWRNQELSLQLKIPVGTVIYLSEEMKHIIYDIDNVQDIYDDEMVGRKWLMNESGLACVDCDGLYENLSYDERKEIKNWLNKLKQLAKSKSEIDLENAVDELIRTTSQHKDDFRKELDYIKILIKKSSLSGLEEINFILKNIDEIINKHL